MKVAVGIPARGEAGSIPATVGRVFRGFRFAGGCQDQDPEARPDRDDCRGRSGEQGLAALDGSEAEDEVGVFHAGAAHLDIVVADRASLNPVGGLARRQPIWDGAQVTCRERSS